MGRMYLYDAPPCRKAATEGNGRGGACGHGMQEDAVPVEDARDAHVQGDDGGTVPGADDLPGAGDMRRFVRATLQARLAAMGVVFAADADEETLRRLVRVATQRQARHQAQHQAQHKGRTGMRSRGGVPVDEEDVTAGDAVCTGVNKDDGEGETHGQ